MDLLGGLKMLAPLIPLMFIQMVLIILPHL